jgi:hypothetical protein
MRGTAQFVWLGFRPRLNTSRNSANHITLCTTSKALSVQCMIEVRVRVRPVFVSWQGIERKRLPDIFGRSVPGLS